jgi:predicted nucleotide-binding protein
LFPAPEGTTPHRTTPITRGDDVFLVHGHNAEIKETVARFLERLGLSVTILHEQVDKGRTIIEKFEDNASVGYAVVLLTGDDVGASRLPQGELAARARQNVILELGYFLGSLGRTHVCALREEGVEVPSDLSGVLYVPLDAAGAWKLRLAAEIKSAGIDVDLNSVM